MATALVNPPVTTTDPATAHTTTSPLARALTTALACIALIWAAVVALLLVMTDTSVLAAVGVGAYAAFWLGGGFGAIFGSAAAFGQDH